MDNNIFIKKTTWLQGVQEGEEGGEVGLVEAGFVGEGVAVGLGVGGGDSEAAEVAVLEGADEGEVSHCSLSLPTSSDCTVSSCITVTPYKLLFFSSHICMHIIGRGY